MNLLIRFSAVLLLTLVGCVPYRKGSFKGPGTVSDSGFFSYYRYHFRFSPPLPLHEPGTQTYNFRGMPKDDMIVWFAITPFRYTEYKKLRSLTTVLSVEVRDDRGTLICGGGRCLVRIPTWYARTRGAWKVEGGLLGPCFRRKRCRVLASRLY
jgi:hypothetical protein